MAAAALAAALPVARGQPYPNLPVKVIVPCPAGQGTDVATRYVAEQLSAPMGQNFVVENRPGAGGNIGTLFVASAAADAYSLLTGTNGTLAAAPFLFLNLGFNPLADFESIALIGVLPLAIVTTPGNPVGKVEKLVAAARA